MGSDALDRLSCIFGSQDNPVVVVVAVVVVVVGPLPSSLAHQPGVAGIPI